MNGPILVVLAAGMGSRYGGLKQMDKFGKHGEVLLDYSVFDALRSGFKKIVFVIRQDIRKDFEETVLRNMGNSIDYELAFQELDKLIPPGLFAKIQAAGRTKPWGTTHALLCAEECIDAPFAVLNADDFYGRQAFAAMGEYLLSPPVKDGAIVPYRLEKTLSPKGSVARGICRIEGGYLHSVNELLSIERGGDGVIYNTSADGSRTRLSPDDPVSMNFWGFPETIFPQFQIYFKEFLEKSGETPKSECYLPMAVDYFLKKGVLEVRALEADSDWFGVTYHEDRAAAIKRIADLTERGIYPEKLWS